MKPSVVQAAVEKKSSPWCSRRSIVSENINGEITIGSFDSFTFLENVDVGLSYIVFVSDSCPYDY
jgi:hypothetical protein